MKFHHLILYIIYSTIRFSIEQTFNFLIDNCLDSFSNRTNVGDVLVYTYHPKHHIGSITFCQYHTVTFPSSNKIATLILVVKNKTIHLAKITYSDLNNDNLLDDLFYHKENDEWHRIDETTFELLFDKLSNKLKTFNINKSPENWYYCNEGLSDQRLCTIKNDYFVKKIMMDKKLIWENESYHTVFAIGMSLRDYQDNYKLLLKIYCTINEQNHIIENEVELTKTYAHITKKAWGLSEDEKNQTQSDLEHTTRFSESDNSVSHQRGPRIPQDTKAIRDRLKEIKLETDHQLDNSQGYKTTKNVMLELDTTSYEPEFGVKVKFVKDGETILWDSDDLTKTFINARFYYKGESPILLNIKYSTQTKCFGISRTHNLEIFFIKSNGWYTLTEEKFNNILNSLSEAATLDRLDFNNSGDDHSPNPGTSDDPDSNQSTNDVFPKDDGPRLKNITLELFPSPNADYRISGFLMDGLDTTYYEPTADTLVKYLKDGNNIIWNCDDKKRTLKYARFCYKKDSKIFLQVLYSTMEGDKLVKKIDYFIKREKWYHSTEEYFHKLLDLLINKVTMRARILNEKVSFEDHIKNLDFIMKGPEPTWFEKNIKRQKQTITKLVPFEYDINDDGYENLVVEVNTKTKFGIYTPKTGFALSRIKDKHRVIWYQELNGLGCTTLYMDFSGNDPLIHLILDDPLDSHLYFKKVLGNWHSIDEEEYEQIRETPTEQSSQSDFVRIGSQSQ